MEKKVIKQNLKNLEMARHLVTSLIKQLDSAVDHGDGAASANKWGKEEETALAALTKLTTLLSKIVPIEQQLSDLEESLEGTKIKTPLSQEDEAIIRRYLERCKEEVATTPS